MLAGQGGAGPGFGQEQGGHGGTGTVAVLGWAGLAPALCCCPELQGRAGICCAARKVHNPPGNSQGKAVAPGLLGKGLSANPTVGALCEQGFAGAPSALFALPPDA